MARGGGRGGGGSFGGGGRSFGGGRGGGRSFGGSRGSGRRLGGGASRGRGGSSRNTGPSNRNTGGSSFGGGYRGRPIMGGWGRSYGGFGGGYGRPYRRSGCGGAGCSGCGGGCLTPIILIIAALFIFNLVWPSVPGSNNQTAVETIQINNSSIEREPIAAGLVNETPYYVDNLEWIIDQRTAEDGLKYFYEKTNIQPVVYITDNINGNPNPTPDEIDAFAEQQYDELFTDEAHLLFVHFENYDYSYHTVYGTQAKVVMDTEAEDILFDYVDYYYAQDSSQITEDDLFSGAFRDTADRIMTVTRSPWIPVAVIVGAIVIIYLLFTWWRSALAKPANKEKPTETQKKDSLDEFDF